MEEKIPSLKDGTTMEQNGLFRLLLCSRSFIYECILKTQLVPGLHPVSGRNVHCICLRLRRQRLPVGQMEYQNIRTVEQIVQTNKENIQPGE